MDVYSFVFFHFEVVVVKVIFAPSHPHSAWKSFSMFFVVCCWFWGFFWLLLFLLFVIFVLFFHMDLSNKGSHMRKYVPARRWLSCPVSIHWVLDPICSLNFQKPFLIFFLCVLLRFLFVGLVLVGVLVFFLFGWFFGFGFFGEVVSPIQKNSKFCISYCQYTKKSLRRHCMECSAARDGVVLLTPTTLLVVKVILHSAGFFP